MFKNWINLPICSPSIILIINKKYQPSNSQIILIESKIRMERIFKIYCLILFISAISSTDVPLLTKKSKASASQNFFLKQKEDLMCTPTTKNWLPNDYQTRTQYFSYEGFFRQFLRNNFLDRRRGLNYEINWGMYVYLSFAGVTFLILALLLRYKIKNINNNLSKLLKFQTLSLQTAPKNMKLSSISFLLLIIAQFTMIGWINIESQKLASLLNSTFCHILSTDESQTAHILSIQGEERSNFHNQMVDYQLKNIKIMELTQKIIRHNSSLFKIQNEGKVIELSKNNSYQIKNTIFKYKKSIVDLRQFANQTINFINILRQKIIVNRNNLIEILKKADNLLQIQEIQPSLSFFTKIFTTGTILIEIFFLLTSFYLSYKSCQNIISYVTFSLFNKGLLAFIFIFMTILLFTTDTTLSLGCTINKDLRNRSSFSDYMNQKRQEEVLFYQKIFGLADGKLTFLNGRALQTIVTATKERIDEISTLLYEKQIANYSQTNFEDDNFKTSLLKSKDYLSSSIKQLNFSLEQLLVYEKKTLQNYNLKQIDNYLKQNQNLICFANLHIIQLLEICFFIAFLLTILQLTALNIVITSRLDQEMAKKRESIKTQPDSQEQMYPLY